MLTLFIYTYYITILSKKKVLIFDKKVDLMKKVLALIAKPPLKLHADRYRNNS